MRISQYLTIMILSVLILTACNEKQGSLTEPATFTDKVAGLFNIPIGNYTIRLTMQVDRQAWNSYTSYSMMANIYDDRPGPNFFNTVDGGTVTISDVSLNSQTLPDNEIIYLASTPVPSTAKVSTWAISGNAQTAVPTFSKSMYVPEEISIITPTGLDDHQNPVTISKSSGISITWNTDPQNEVGVLVVLEFHNKMFEPDPSEPDVRFAKVVPDNGSYTITPQDLVDFPDGEKVSLSVTRGNYFFDTVLDENVFAYARITYRGVARIQP